MTALLDHQKIILSKVNRAEVFLDNGAAESFHWSTVKPFFFKYGALNLKEMSSFESCDPSVKKAVFLCTEPLQQGGWLALKSIITLSQSLHDVTLISASVSVTRGDTAAHSTAGKGPAVSSLTFPEIPGEALKSRWQSEIMTWINKSEASCDIHFIPFGCISPLPQIILPPCHKNIIKTIKEVLEFYKASQMPKQTNPLPFPSDSLAEMKVMADFLNNIMEGYKVKDDVLSIGPMSSLLASEIVQHPPAKLRRNKYQRKATLILVDGSLDLVARSCSQSDNLLDTVYRQLDQFQGFSSDVAISLLPLVYSSSDKYLPLGCLANNSNDKSRQLLEKISSLKTKEGLMELQRQLTQVLMDHGGEVASKATEAAAKSVGKFSAQTLTNTVSLFRETSPDLLIEHAGLVQLGLAVTQASSPSALGLRLASGDSTDPAKTKKQKQRAIDELQRLEKAFLSQAEYAEEQERLLCDAMVKEMEATSEDKTFTLDSLVNFLVYCLSLISPQHGISHDTWKSMRITLTHLICKEYQKEHLLIETGESKAILLPILVNDHYFNLQSLEDSQIVKAVDRIIHVLEHIHDSRKNLQVFKNLVDTSVIPQYKPLLVQIMADLCKPSRTENPDFENKSSGLREKLKLGLGYFVNVSKPNPADAQDIFVFVLGNVSWSELRAAKEVVSMAKPAFQVHFGCLDISKGLRDLPRLFAI